MSIELAQKVKRLEQQLEEVNRQIAQLQAKPKETPPEPVKRGPGRPPKHG